MLQHTNNDLSPWIIVDSNDKKLSRLESIKYLLSKFNISNQKINIDKNIVKSYENE
jgi:polyphosphate kinase 2 (PPK2 family)